MVVGDDVGAVVMLVVAAVVELLAVDVVVDVGDGATLSTCTVPFMPV